jgi:tripartite-type tricarboxylate transporter receptor subunit TctC
MKTRMRTIAAVVAAVAVLATAFGVAAQQFPTRNIDLVVPYPPGGPSDTMGRALAAELQKVLGQPVVVVNRAGAAGTVGTGFVARARPDGYTMVLASSSMLTVFPHFERVEYDAAEDFTFLGLLYRQAPMVAVSPDAPWRTMEDLLAYAAANPGKLNYGSWGQFGGGHIAMEAIGREKGIDWVHIPYRGDGPAMTALLGGHVPVVVTASGHIPHIRAGKARALMVLTAERSRLFPEVPTMKEVGLAFQGKGSTEVISGILAPKGVPGPVAKTLEQALQRAVAGPEFVRAAETMSVEVDFRPGAEMAREVREGYQYVGEMVQQLGLKP